MKNAAIQFDSVIAKINEFKEKLKQNLKEIVLENCKTYGEVDKFLLLQIKDANWNNNHFKLMIIEELKEEFEREKNNLSIK